MGYKASSVVQSNDLIAYEDLRIENLVKNHCLAKSINDAGWYQFRVWLEYFAKVFKRVTIAVPPAYTSQECSSCGGIVKKISFNSHSCLSMPCPEHVEGWMRARQGSQCWD